MSISDPEREISIPLPEKYWVIVLAMLEDYVQRAAIPKLEALQKSGKDYRKLPPEEITSLVGPILARGIIVKQLSEAGVMTPEANEKVGIDKFTAMAEKFAADQK